MICLSYLLSPSRTVANEHILTYDAVGAESAEPFLLFPSSVHLTSETNPRQRRRNYATLLSKL